MAGRSVLGPRRASHFLLAVLEAAGVSEQGPWLGPEGAAAEVAEAEAEVVPTAQARRAARAGAVVMAGY
jgi:hypothetical protein